MNTRCGWGGVARTSRDPVWGNKSTVISLANRRGRVGCWTLERQCGLVPIHATTPFVLYVGWTFDFIPVVWLLRRVPRSAGHAAPPAAGIHATTPCSGVSASAGCSVSTRVVGPLIAPYAQGADWAQAVAHTGSRTGRSAADRDSADCSTTTHGQPEALGRIMGHYGPGVCVTAPRATLGHTSLPPRGRPAARTTAVRLLSTSQPCLYCQ